MSGDQKIVSNVGGFLFFPNKEIKENDLRGPKFWIHNRRISIILGSVIKGVYSAMEAKTTYTGGEILSSLISFDLIKNWDLS